MFGWDVYERIQEVQRSLNPDAAERQKAEEIINKAGRGICEHCGEEIFKNDAVSGGGWTWESESMVGFCDKIKTNKHKPIVRWSRDEGVHNVQEEGTNDSPS